MSDEANGLSTSRQLTFTSKNDVAYFEYDYVVEGQGYTVESTTIRGDGFSVHHGPATVDLDESRDPGRLRRPAMLQLGSRTFTVSGVTVYGDHADPDQFWYIPAPVRIARRPPNDSPQLTLIMYEEDVAGVGIDGGGFLMLETEIVLDDDTRHQVLVRVRAAIGRLAAARPGAVRRRHGAVHRLEPAGPRGDDRYRGRAGRGLRRRRSSARPSPRSTATSRRCSACSSTRTAPS